MTPSTMSIPELWSRILELREAGREVTRLIMRAQAPAALRLLSIEWSAITRGEVALLDELAARGEAAP